MAGVKGRSGGHNKKSTAEKMSDGNPGGRTIKTRSDKLKTSKPKTPKELSEPMQKAYNEILAYVERADCLGFVDDSLLFEYAVCRGRWLECEQKITENGVIGLHPTTGGDIESIYFKVGLKYLEQADKIWKVIDNIVRENNLVDVKHRGTVEDPMAQLIASMQE